MSAAADALGSALRPRWGAPPPSATAMLRGAIAAVLLGGVIAGAVAIAPLHYVLLGAVGLVAACVVLAAPGFGALALGVSLPAIEDLTGGHLGGVHVAASDLLLVLIGVRLLADGVVRRGFPALGVTRRVGFPLLQYAWLIAILLCFHLGLGSALKSVQRLELFALPVLVGAYLTVRGYHMRLLRGYVVACTLLAVIWPILNSHHLAGELQKNPVGGFIASAIILVLGVRSLRRFFWCVPVLLVGLALTASRGAVLALAVGMIVLVLVQAGGSRRSVVIAEVLALLVIGVGVYLVLPASITSRLTNYNANFNSKSSIALLYREDYAQQAEKIIAAHPWTGVGVGDYIAGSARLLTQTSDPHDVVLLEAAEGGYVFLASFIVLILGSAYAMWRARRVELAAAAAAVLLATVAHGLVDVYWARGTPVLGWLLVGMVCALALPGRAEALQ